MRGAAGEYGIWLLSVDDFAANAQSRHIPEIVMSF
jgi:hypothetical protein